MANEYSLINSSGVQYDEAGNLTKDEDGYAMRYDGDGQLDLVYLDNDSSGTFNSGDTAVGEYKYDALGRRIEFKNYYDGSGIYCGSTPCTVTTRYVQDGQNVIAEYNAASTPVRQRYFVHGTSYIDERAVMRDEVPTTPKDYYYLLKNLYTVVGLANKQGHEVERYVYDAYGKATIWSTLTGDVNFNGEVNGNDRSVLLGAWTSGQGVCGAAGGPIFDLNADGLINGNDRSVLIGQWTSPNNKNTVLPASALGNPYAFTGRTLDVFKDAITGSPGSKAIHHDRTRYYDAEHGRSLQRDPLQRRAERNLYEGLASLSGRSAPRAKFGMYHGFELQALELAPDLNVMGYEAKCNPLTGIVKIEPHGLPPGDCTGPCQYLHELVHKAYRTPACLQVNQAIKKCGKLPNREERVDCLGHMVNEYSGWQSRTSRFTECQAYSVDSACLLGMMITKGCCFFGVSSSICCGYVQVQYKISQGAIREYCHNPPPTDERPPEFKWPPED